VRTGNKVNHPTHTHCKRGHELIGENIYFHLGNRGYVNRTCRICRNERTAAWNSTRTPEDIEKARVRKMRLLYQDFSEEKYQILHAEQHGLCKICGRSETGNRRLSTDHDHDTKQTRSLLCRRCNTALGNFDDNIELLTKAIKYLEFWKEV
jgi:hypothetical protein